MVDRPPRTFLLFITCIPSNQAQSATVFSFCLYLTYSTLIIPSSSPARMKYATAALALAGAVAVSASPTPTIEKRAEICGQWDSATTGSYTLYQDLWGEDNASSGSQCSEIDSLSGSDIAWHTTYDSSFQTSNVTLLILSKAGPGRVAPAMSSPTPTS